MKRFQSENEAPHSAQRAGIGTLRLDNLKLYGRSREISLLSDVFERVSAAPTRTDDARPSNVGSASSELVLVSGKAGVGKTSLVRQLEIDRGDYGWFVSGKFDRLRRSEPYSAIVSAFESLFRRILEDSDALRRVRNALSDILPADKESTLVLSSLFPILLEVIGDDERYDKCDGRKLSFKSSNGSSSGRNRFNSSFCSLFRAACCPNKPVVLFLDDVQWADLASLDLITALLTDPKSSNVMYVISYRENEVDITHPLTDRIQKVQDKNVMHTTEISVDNLDVNTINCLLSDVTRLDPNETRPLTDVVMQRSQGNIFFILRFLESLIHEGLLAYSLASFKWTWDIHTIETSTVICDNVVDLVLDKLGRLPGQVQELLKIASCMGCFFDADLLERTISEHYQTSELSSRKGSSNCDVKCSLNVAIREALVEKVHGSMYKFVHDKVQQAAYSLFENEWDNELWHLCIGKSMHDCLQGRNGGKENDWMLFATVDQLNLGSNHISSQTERTSLAEMNRRAGEKAALSSAFFPAASYLQKGIQLIQHDGMWKGQYELTLGLYRKLALVEYACGNVAKSKQSASLVIANARSTDDKLGAYFTLFKVLCYIENTPEKGLSVGIECLRELGEKMDRNPSWPAVWAEHLKMKRMLRGHSERSLLDLPLIQNERKEAAMKMIMLMTPCSIALLRPNLYAAITIRVLQLSLKHGVCAITAVAFANYGSLLCRKSDFDNARKFGRLALMLKDQLDNDEWKGPAVYCVFCLINHWREPLQHSIDPLLKEYENSLLHGDVNLAFTCLNGYFSHYLNSGLPLAPLESDMKAYCHQMSEYNQKSAPLLALPMWQFILNLLGRAENPLVLTGEAMNQEEIMNLAQKVSMKSVATIHFLRLQLSFYFGDLSGCQYLVPVARALAKKMRDAVFDMCRFVFFDGLVSFALAQRGAGTGKWRRSARRAMKKMQDWVKRGAINILHMFLLLKAEYYVLAGKNYTKVRKAFDIAISTAGRNGFVHDKAIAAERAGLYFFRMEDMDRASYYLSTAHSAYLSWGARAKASALLTEHSELLKETKQSKETEIGYRGRSRFSRRTIDKHKKLSFSGLSVDSTSKAPSTHP